MEDIKEIIKVFKCLEFDIYEWGVCYDGKLQINCDTMTTYLDKLLNYIEQLEKENRKLSNIIEAINQTTPINMVTNTDYSLNIDKNSIPKSVIREKIEELENSSVNFCNTYWVSMGAVEKIAEELLGEVK